MIVYGNYCEYLRRKLFSIIQLGLNVWGDPRCQRKDKRFGPHGIDLNKRYDGSYQLAVVNHFPEESVEFFELSQNCKVRVQLSQN